MIEYAGLSSSSEQLELNIDYMHKLQAVADAARAYVRRLLPSPRAADLVAALDALDAGRAATAAQLYVDGGKWGSERADGE